MVFKFEFNPEESHTKSVELTEDEIWLLRCFVNHYRESVVKWYVTKEENKEDAQKFINNIRKKLEDNMMKGFKEESVEGNIKEIIDWLGNKYE